MNRDSLPKRDTSRQASRRQFLAQTGKAAAASALATAWVPRVHAAEDNMIRLALIGCGGRGNGAVANAMNSVHGPVKLVAMADLVESRLKLSRKALGDRFGERIDVPADRQFLGFDAYKKAIDCLGPNDIAMLTNYSCFRPLQLEYAVRKGVNVFMEKSFAPDIPGLRRLIKAGEEAEKKNLKIAAGLQWRHSANRQELIQRIRDGAIGDVQLIRAYRVHACGGLGKRPPEQNELLWQIGRFVHFLWVSGGLFAEMNIHQIDELCWIKDAWPVSAHGVGGRAANSTDCGQNLDSLSIEWTFADGTKAYDVVRWLGGHCHSEFATYVHGTKCAAQFNTYGLRAGETARLYQDQRIGKDTLVWETPPEAITSWDAEWNVLLDSIRRDKPQNETKRAAYSNVADLMGRAAVHSGKLITWDEALASNFQFYPNIDAMDYDTLPPVQADDQGRYPVPVPGVWSEL
ncbi:MAG: Gfo/Idh/MocA family oxidoreductase [Candidatus Anammoximicrobium sp.]|nr:Gfo/Idh/MocA family oxidoreductase [Candidatus Anammoximicrobium sp.]